MGKRFAIVIGVAAAGVMALGAQTVLAGGDRGPDLQLSGPKKQDPQADKICDGGRCQMHVKASCGDEACTIVSVKGKLTKVKQNKLENPRGEEDVDLAPGETKSIGPELLKESQRREVRKALADGENVQAKVTVRAKDAAGNVATAKRTIKLVE
jgi:hypothetical protein